MTVVANAGVGQSAHAGDAPVNGRRIARLGDAEPVDVWTRRVLTVVSDVGRDGSPRRFGTAVVPVRVLALHGLTPQIAKVGTGRLVRSIARVPRCDGPCPKRQDATGWSCRRKGEGAARLAAVDGELAVRLGEVVVDGADGDEQVFGNRPARLAAQRPLDDIDLAVGEWRGHRTGAGVVRWGSSPPQGCRRRRGAPRYRAVGRVAGDVVEYIGDEVARSHRRERAGDLAERVDVTGVLGDSVRGHHVDERRARSCTNLHQLVDDEVGAAVAHGVVERQRSEVEVGAGDASSAGRTAASAASS